MVDFSKQEDVTQWLDAIEPETRRREVAVVIAARAALRVAPHLEQAVPRAKRERDAALSAIVLPVFRATALPWVAAVYPTHRNEISLRAPVENSLRAPVAATSAPVAATSAAAAAAATSAAAAAAATSAAAASRAAAYAATIAAYAATPADAAWIDAGRSTVDLARARLWLEGAPAWATDAWQALKSALLVSHEDWRVWTDWYEARLAGAAADEALEVARALIDDEIWEQGPRAVNAEIARLIKLHTPPESELGAAIGVVRGEMTVSNAEAIGEFDRPVQSALHQQLRSLCPALLAKTEKVGNTHPDLLSLVSEYGKLIEAPIDELDVVAAWAVGTGVMAICDTLSRLPQSGIMAEPLEPEHLAQLKQVAVNHGAFILGFELGQKLTDRADRARLQPEVLSNIIPAARVLLDRWSRAANFVEARTREFFATMSNAAVEPSWRVARSGYVVYAVTKDSLIAIGRALLASHSVASTFAGGAFLSAVDPNLPHHVQFMIDFLMANGRTILSFSEPFPELKFWLSEILEALEKDRAFRAK